MPVPCEDVGSSTQCHWTKTWCLLLSRHVIRQALTRQWQGIWLFQPSERREDPTFDQFWSSRTYILYINVYYTVYIYEYVGFLSRGGFPKSSMFIGLSIINHPVWGCFGVPPYQEGMESSPCWSTFAVRFMGDSQRPASLADMELFGNRAPLNSSVAHHNPPKIARNNSCILNPSLPIHSGLGIEWIISKSAHVVPEMRIYHDIPHFQTHSSGLGWLMGWTSRVICHDIPTHQLNIQPYDKWWCILM